MIQQFPEPDVSGLDLARMRDLAVGLAQRAGALAAQRFGSDVGATAKGTGTDVVTDVDHAAEELIIGGLLEEFSDHAVLGEESGAHGDRGAPVHWLVDPLDGTNNYVLGVPLFGSCITACVDDEPVVAVMHNSITRITTSAVLGGGTVRTTPASSSRLRLGPAPELRRQTISWCQGYPVTVDDPFRIAAMDAMESSVKRVLRTWSPSVDWGLVCEGNVGAIVLYRNEIWDLVGGLLLVREAGGAVARQTGRDCVIAGHPDVVADLAPLLDR